MRLRLSSWTVRQFDSNVTTENSACRCTDMWWALRFEIFVNWNCHPDVVIRSPGAGALFQTRSTGTSWSRDNTRDTSENAWPRPCSARCWRWRWAEVTAQAVALLSANLCSYNEWRWFVAACPSGRDQTEAGGVYEERTSAEDQGGTSAFKHGFAALPCISMTHGPLQFPICMFPH